MVTIINNRTDEVIRRLNVTIWTLAAVLFCFYSVVVSYQANASLSTEPDNTISLQDTVSLDPANRVALQVLERQERQREAKRALAASPTHKRLNAIYSHLPRPKDLGLEFDRAAKKYNVSARLLLSMCVAESHLGVRKRNSSGATGICQIIPSQHGTTARAMYDYRKNIDLAAKILSDYSKQCGGQWCAVQAYNVGITAYKKGVRARGYLATVKQEYNKQIRSI